MQLPCSRRTFTFFLASLPLLVAIDVFVFRSLDDRRFRQFFRLHVWAIIEVGLFSSAWYIWWRVTHLFNSKNLLTFGGLFRALLFVILSLSLLTTLAGPLLMRTDPSLIALVCSFCVGLVIFLLTSLVIADVLSLIVRKVICRIMYGASSGENRPVGGKSPSRDTSDKNKLEVKIRTLVALLCALFLAISGVIGISRLAIERVHIPIKGLHHHLNGTTIVQISDIHLGPYIGRLRLKNILELVNQLEGDIVVITGDLVDAKVADLSEVVKPLADIKSKHGVFYVTGNILLYTQYFIVHIPVVVINSNYNYYYMRVLS